jgi:hypothetical protein
VSHYHLLSLKFIYASQIKRAQVTFSIGFTLCKIFFFLLVLLAYFSYVSFLFDLYFVTCLTFFVCLFCYLSYLLNLFHWLLLKLVVILALFTFRLVLFFCMLLVTQFTVVTPYYLVCFTCLVFLFDSLFVRFFYRSYLLTFRMLVFCLIHIWLLVSHFSYAYFLTCLICITCFIGSF